MEALEIIGQKAKEAKVSLALLGQAKKNETLCAVAEALCASGAEILEGNKVDVEAAKANGMSEGLLDRLTLTTARIEALADGAVACGLPRDKAMTYAAATMEGAAKMFLSSNQHPGALKDAVCSPGGSTIAGVRVLEDKAFRSAAMECVVAAYKKNKELGK